MLSLVEVDLKANNTTSISAISGILWDDTMWSEAVLNDPATLPALLKFVRSTHAMAQQVAVRRLGHYGPAAKDAVPHLIPHVADADTKTRGAARAALDRIDPGWMKHPALTDAAAAILYPADTLPEKEADELIAAIGDLPPAAASALGGAMAKKLTELDSNTHRSRTKAELDSYVEQLDTVFGPVERLGTRARLVAANLYALIVDNANELNDPRSPRVFDRALKSLDIIASDDPGHLAAVLPRLKYDETKRRLIRRAGKAAVAHVGTLLDDTLNGNSRLLGLWAAADLGPDAADLVPKMIPLLKESDVDDTVSVDGRPQEVWRVERVVQALNTVDHAWWGRPEAAGALLGLVRAQEFEDRATTEKRAKVLRMVADAGPAVKPLVPRLAA